VSTPGSVGGNEPLRLFVALRLPSSVLDAVAAWQERELGARRGVDGWRADGRIVPRDHLHVTLAFLGSRPSRDLEDIVAAVDAAAIRTPRIELEIERYRQTRSVGMLVLSDRSGAAAALADDLQERLEALGVYRRENRSWLPHITVVRLPDRLRAQPPSTRVEPPLLAAFAPSDAAVFLSRLHPSGARYEVLDTRALHSLK